MTGAGTALLGEKAAMACTVAVEEVIGEHYDKYESPYIRNMMVLPSLLLHWYRDH